MPSSVSALFTKAAEIRSQHAQAEAQREKIAADGITIAFKLVLKGGNETDKAAIEREARSLGARPNRRSGIEHLAVYIVWPRGTISPSLRTRYAQAVRAGLERGCSPEEFRRLAAEGASGKGGIKELARIGRGPKAPTTTPPTDINPSSDPKQSAHSTNADRPIPLREKGYPRAVIVPEPVVESLLASDLKTGDLFQLVVRVTRTNGLEAVKYLRPRRTS